ncbi:MAG: hypothetical protein BroJett042_10710 [Bacteroidota bacterium]|nr:MAG: hypothetical protein BroJett042_10710 [Bacteroidota bacterium]
MKKVRRSLWSYMSYGLLLLLCLSKLFLTQTSWTYYWIFIGLGSLVILTRLILKPYYFETRGTRLIINRDFFYEDYVEIDDIDKIESEEGPFSKSHIRLKDHKMGLDFNYFIVNDKDFNRLKESLQLRVE